MDKIPWEGFLFSEKETLVYWCVCFPEGRIYLGRPKKESYSEYFEIEFFKRHFFFFGIGMQWKRHHWEIKKKKKNSESVAKGKGIMRKSNNE